MNDDLDWGYSRISLLDRLDEIEKALNAKLYQAALALALTIPDICGMIERHLEHSNADAYAQWFDNHVVQKYLCFKNEDGTNNTNKRVFNGTVCYKLRCAFLHSGNDEIKNAGFLSIPEKERLDYKAEYKLILNTDLENSIECGTDQAEMTRQYSININVPSLCRNICDAARTMIFSWDDQSVFYEHGYLIYSSQKWNEDRKAFQELN